ncbi:hypothetical protein C7410_115176 [Paraburkholderia silvatlantica]|uniref:Uncharacterized protein n=1 Tax=Paraburkholderia silvatlantica TaxID=321895 RepID=A0A2V4TT64_9BURK|nr:hypothetical protein [Paraburkholderia silvatlantica]PYE21333.1 hypothetical protein C7410_115176 [Paraburkholderia silvatlantica]
MTANLQTNVPLVNAPFVDDAGYITEPWLLFLVQLFRRTGGTGGGGSGTLLTLKDVIALDQTFSPLPANQESALAQMITTAPMDLSQPIPEMVFPAAVPDILDQTFSSGTDFTPGTTASLTLASSFASAARLWIFFDAAFQGDDQYSLSGTTLTFTSPIPVGTSKVYVKGLI